MRAKQKTVKAVAIIIALIMIITSFSFVFFLPSAFGAESTVDDFTPEERIEILEAYIEYIKENYKDEIDYNTLITGAFQGVTESLGDVHSVYFAEDKVAENFVTEVDGRFYGIGVQINMGTEGVTVVRPITGSPARAVGIQAGDVIVKIDGTDVSQKSLNEVADMLKGKEGTTVNLTVKRGTSEKNFSVTRAEVNAECVLYEMPEDGVGHLTMTGFDNDASVEFENAVADLQAQGMKRLIIDLRSNTGGYMEQAEKIADLILEDCDITHYMVRDKIIETIRANDGKSLDMPMVVLVNGESASSSEILAAALKGQNVPLVGTKTYGKGIAQAMMSLADGKTFKLSVHYFLTPDKVNYNGKGLDPDYLVRSSAATEEELAARQKEYNSFAPMTESVKPVQESVGLNVYGAQQRLKFLGYNTEVSGIMSRDTVAAMNKFQADQGLFVYGTLDYTTRNTLDEVARQYANGISKEDVQLQKAIEVVKSL